MNVSTLTWSEKECWFLIYGLNICYINECNMSSPIKPCISASHITFSHQTLEFNIRQMQLISATFKIAHL